MSKFICCHAPRWQRTCVCVLRRMLVGDALPNNYRSCENNAEWLSYDLELNYHMIWSWIFLFLYRAFCFLLKQWQATASARWRRWGFTCTRKLIREFSSECPISVELFAFVFSPYITPYLHLINQEGDFKWASERVSDERVSDERCVDAYS